MELRVACAPSEADRARVSAGLAALLAGAQLTEVAARVDASMDERARWLARPASYMPWVKGLVSVAVLGGLGFGGWFAVRNQMAQPSEPAVSVLAVAPASTAARNSGDPLQLTKDLVPAAAAAASAPDEAAHLAQRAAGPLRHKARAKVDAPASEASASDALSQELSLIRAASAALRAGDYAAASTALAEHAARFPEGALGRERRGLHALVLCATAPSDAATRTAAAAFSSEAGASPLAERVRRACQAPSEH